MNDAEIERTEGALEDQWQDSLGYDLDDLYAEDAAALDFAAEPQPLEGLDAIDRRLATLRNAQRQLAAFDQVAESRRAELEQRITEGRRTMLERVGYLTRSLQISHQAIVADDPKRTRIELPNGVLSSKAGGVEWEWPKPDSPEDAALLEWARVHLPSAYVPPTTAPVPARVAKLPLKGELKTAATTKRNGVTVPASEDGLVRVNGEVVPGLTVRAKSREFTPLPSGLDETEVVR